MTSFTPTKRPTFDVKVPFAGFYGSMHESAIDDAILQSAADDNLAPYNNLLEILQRHIDYGDLFSIYAREYVTWLASRYDALQSLTFDELVSPREYNFETDRVFATIARGDLARILKVCRGHHLKQAVADLSTTRSGFISSYPNRIEEWPPCSGWDHNHVGIALLAFLRTETQGKPGAVEDEFAQGLAYDGRLDEMIYAAADHTGQAAMDLAGFKRNLCINANS